MKKINVNNYLTRKDKWYLGGGNRLVWTPPFPLWLEKPGFWDKANYYTFEIEPVFTVALLNEQGSELPCRFLGRKWYPAFMLQRYRSGSKITIDERKALLPNDCLISELTLHNTSEAPQTIHVILWTIQKTDPRAGNYLTGIEFENEAVRFIKHVKQDEQPLFDIACALGMNRTVSSYGINLSEGTTLQPHWKFTPFYENFAHKALGNEMKPGGTNDGGLLYIGLHTELYLPPNTQDTVVLVFSAGNSREDTLASLDDTRSRTAPIRQSFESWSTYFSGLPYFRCSDPYFQKYYWYRWYGLRLFTIQGGEGNYPFPAVCEGLGCFRLPISYSAQCHILETRWMPHPAIAQGSLLNFIHHQQENGSFIGHIHPRCLGSEVFYHANWGHIWQLNAVHPNDSFLQNAYEGLSAYVRYFDRDRDTEKSGLYDIINHFETGQEYMHRYMAVNEHADQKNWGVVFRLKGVDATVYIYEIKRMLAKIAGRLSREDESEQWKSEADKIRHSVLQKMWDKDEELFFDVDARTGEPTGVKAATCFYPYFTDIISREHLAGLKRHLFNPEEFWTPYPVPSSSADDAYFHEEGQWKGKRMLCPWNGRVWPMTNSHIAEAIAQPARRFNDTELKQKAVEFITAFIRMMFFDGDSDRPNSFEHYNPTSGEPSLYRGVDDYQHSWVVDLIMKYLCGINPQEHRVIVDPFPFDVDYFLLDSVVIRGTEIKVQRKGQNYTVWHNRKRCAESRIGNPVEIRM